MLEQVRKEDIPKNYKDIIDVVGLDGFLGLVQMYGGSILYLPTVNSLNKNSRNRIIRKTFRGDYDEIARKFNMSRSQIYNIVNK